VVNCDKGNTEQRVVRIGYSMGGRNSVDEESRWFVCPIEEMRVKSKAR